MKLGVMTGGGDCSGLNAAIRAVTRSAVYGHGFEVVGILNGFEGLINAEARPLQPANVRGILRIGGTILGSSNHTNPFAYHDPETGSIIDASERAYQTVRDLNLDALIVIGGDGTLTLANLFAGRYDVPIVGIPKTIDNDVHGTDYAIGFDTAVAVVTDAIDRLHTTAESHHRVMLIEVMGRTAGWIALYAGVAGGADIVLIPEREFNMQGIMEAIERRRGFGHHFTIAAIAEGVPMPDGARIYRSKEGERHQWKLGGVCESLESTLSQSHLQDVRSIVLGHLQRGGDPTAFDRTLATQLGATAVEAIARGEDNQLVGMLGGAITLSPLETAANGPRLVPDDHPLITAAQRMGMYVGG